MLDTVLSRRLSAAQRLTIQTFFKVLILAACGFATVPATAATVSGNLSKWSPITIDFTGVSANETDTSPNPFLDYRLTVIFTAPSGNTHTVPGFFAGDGNGFGSGNHWQARFAANEVGTWRYRGLLHSGNNVAIDTNLANGNEIALDNAEGQFDIVAQSESAAGFLKYGRLNYVGEHYLKFSDGPYWIKAGTDSPENFLGYAGFDGTVDQNGNFLHRFENHVQDAASDDPVFSNQATGVDGRGLTGALNYLSEQGVNSIYFLPMNLGGDGQETYPFVGGTNNSFNKTHYDISKLYQWNEVLKHAQRRGIALNIQLSETELANEKWLDNGNLGVERKLFFRELIARFGYLLAAKWNLGEENDFPVSELRAHADYIRSLDWTAKPVAVHTQINNFRDYEQIIGEERFSASSIQYHQEFAGEFVEQWRTRSTEAGHPWVIDMDENTNGLSDSDHEQRRKQILYDVLFSGGNIEWYFGYYPQPLGGDIDAGDFRLRENMWRTTRHAREFMQNELPFWRMQPMDSIVSNENQAYGGAEVFGAVDEVYAVYLPNANGGQNIDLQGTSNTFVQQWFNPVSGQFEGSSRELAGGQRHALGNPPSRSNDDWVVLVRSNTAVKPAEFELPEEPVNEDEPVAEPTVQPDNQDTGDANTDDTTAEDQTNNDEPAVAPADNALPVITFGEIPVAIQDQPYSLVFTASDADGVAPAVTAEILPPQITLRWLSDGVFELSGQLIESDGDMVTIEIIAFDERYRSVRVTESINIPVRAAIESTPDTTEPISDAPAEDVNAEEPSTPTVAPELTNNSDTDTPPIILGAQDVQAMVGNTLRMVIFPVDGEGIVPAVRAIELPNGAAFDDNGNGTRTLVWTPTDADIGDHIIMYVATDAGPTPHVVMQDITITVIANDSDSAEQPQSTPAFNYPPLFGSIGDKQVRLGETISFVVRPIDPEGIAPILHVKSAPQDSSFKDNNNGSRSFEWVASGPPGEVIELEFIAIDSQDNTLSASMRVKLSVVP